MFRQQQPLLVLALGRGPSLPSPALFISAYVKAVGKLIRGALLQNE